MTAPDACIGATAQAEEYVPLPKGDVHKKKEVVQVTNSSNITYATAGHGPASRPRQGLGLAYQNPLSFSFAAAAAAILLHNLASARLSGLAQLFCAGGMVGARLHARGTWAGRVATRSRRGQRQATGGSRYVFHAESGWRPAHGSELPRRSSLFATLARPCLLSGLPRPGDQIVTPAHEFFPPAASLRRCTETGSCTLRLTAWPRRQPPCDELRCKSFCDMRKPMRVPRVTEERALLDCDCSLACERGR